MVGIAVALSVIVLWLVSLAYALTQIEVHRFIDFIPHLGWLLWIQLLYVGLFITAHDACHGTVAPGRTRVNLWIGRVAAFLYAGFYFDHLVVKHLAHHQNVGKKDDPDFHSLRPGYHGFFYWILRFFWNYLTVRQLILMSAIAQCLMHGVHLPEANVLGFWVLPAVLSALQLFFFGTYLPHRIQGSACFPDRHHARNLPLPRWMSFVSCFHFGAYHHDHHLKPGVPWYSLPTKCHF
jgi:beta-carotene ketolase (CrtW type)